MSQQQLNSWGSPKWQAAYNRLAAEVCLLLLDGKRGLFDAGLRQQCLDSLKDASGVAYLLQHLLVRRFKVIDTVEKALTDVILREWGEVGICTCEACQISVVFVAAR